MINEDRVKELYRMAVYDAYEDEKCQQTGKYYISDYVGKEMIKSFFTGTIAFILLVILWGIGDVSALIAFINNADVTDLLNSCHYAVCWVCRALSVCYSCCVPGKI